MKAVWFKRLLRLSAHLPLWLNHAMGGFSGRRALRGDRTELRTARTNLTLCFPERSESQRQQLLQQTMVELGKTFSEAGTLWYGSQQQVEKLVYEVRGEALLKAGLARGKGVILAAPHLGNWELIGAYCSQRYPMTNLYRPPRQAGMDEVLRDSRERFGSKLAPTNAKGVRALYHALKNNELVGILPDQDPGENGGQFAPFFGVQTNTMTLLSRLAQKSGATVLCVWAERLPGNRGFVLHFSPVADDIYSDDMLTSVTALNQAVEAAIRQIPAQYQWGYKRFRTRPVGAVPLYG